MVDRLSPMPRDPSTTTDGLPVLRPQEDGSGEAAVSASGLVKSYGSVKALVGVDLEVAHGTVMGLLGPNGAGKTTIVRILTTLLKPDAGTARVAGLDVVADAALLRERIGLAGQYAAVDENLTGLENLTMVGRLYGMPRAEAKRRGNELLERFDLLDAAGRADEDVLGRDASPARPGRRARGQPADPVPRRADNGPRSPQPPAAVGDDRGSRRRRHDGAADDAVPRRGRPAGDAR